MRIIPNNHSLSFRAAIKTNPYSQTFITAVRKPPIYARSPFSLSSTQSQRKRNLRNVLMDFSKQPLKPSQPRQTWFHHPAIFFQRQAIIIICTAFLAQVNSICPSINNVLMKGSKNKYESTEHNLQEESVCQLQTDLSPSFSLPPTGLLSTVKKKKQHIATKRPIEVCHQLSHPISAQRE